MAERERPSWKDIDRMRDGSSSRRRNDRRDKKPIKEHSTRYDKYKADLNRLFDQGMAGELIKKTAKPEPKADEPDKKNGDKKNGDKAEAKASTRRKGNGRIPKDASKSASRFKLIRAVIDASDTQTLNQAVDALVEQFGLPDDWEVLVRVVEHPDEALVRRAVERMTELLPQTAKVPRRASLKERLRTIGQTASDSELRQLAEDLSGQL